MQQRSNELVKVIIFVSIFRNCAKNKHIKIGFWRRTGVLYTPWNHSIDKYLNGRNWNRTRRSGVGGRKYVDNRDSLKNLIFINLFLFCKNRKNATIVQQRKFTTNQFIKSKKFEYSLKKIKLKILKIKFFFFFSLKGLRKKLLKIIQNNQF